MQTLIEIKYRKTGNVDVFEFIGELDETNADKTFTSIDAQLTESHATRVVFLLRELKYLNSKSIGWIAEIFERITSQGGNMHIAAPSEDVYSTLDLVGMTSLLNFSKSEDEAVQALSV